MKSNGMLTSIEDIDLTPIPGKTYFNTTREWREEFIYFLMVDRFHDDTTRSPVRQHGRSPGIATPDDFYGGKIKGITQNLDYIAGLGCTAIWLSPVYENNPHAYHGYNINNYLSIDPHFGSKQDLVDLVDAAHRRNPPMRVILDVVINHSGDNWAYPGDYPYYFSNDQQFPFGFWRRADRPIPVELRNENFYHRRGQIHSPNGWDAYPEVQHGDVVTLKDYIHEDDVATAKLMSILIAAHCYWIREADIDGFRVDAVKHMGELACSAFCTGVREYAHLLGKRDFFLFGEVASADDEILDRYIGQNTSKTEGGKTVFYGLDSVLDFRLAFNLPSVLKGFRDPQTIFDRLQSQHHRALHIGEVGRYLVTFIDNHDSFWLPGGRYSHHAPDEQVIAGIGFILCALGTPCIYYGTEQGFEGYGGDNQIREAMFDQNRPGVNLLNPEAHIYREIAQIASVRSENAALRFGRMVYRQISDDGQHFGLPFGIRYTLAFSRILFTREVLVAYNVSDQPRQDCVEVDRFIRRPGDRMDFQYGNAGSVIVQEAADGTLYVPIQLQPHQFVILE